MKKGDIIRGGITAMAYGGKGIMKQDGFVIFVKGAILGEYVEAEITKKKKDHAEADVVKIIEESALEQKLPYQPTPGAPWMKLPLDTQQKIKRELVFDLFLKFAKIDLSLFWDDFIASPENWFYRNKMEYSFGPTDETSIEDEEGKKTWEHTGFGLGSKKRGQFWLVDTLEKPSGMFDKPFEGIILDIKEWCEATGLDVYNQRTNSGFFRHLVVRKSFYDEGFLVNLVTHSENADKFDHQGFQDLLLNSKIGKSIKGISWTHYAGVGDTTAHYEERKKLYGSDHFEEQMSELSFRVSLDSFFQPNIFSAEEIYKKVVEYAGLKNGQQALDLFCGTGTIGQILAKENPKSDVIGVDIVTAAIEDARSNAQKNTIENITFYDQDVNDFLKTFEGEIDVLVVDPPRAGITPKALEKVIEVDANTLVYVSCNPATMARDIGVLKNNGYQLEKFSLVDQFPHTPHVESIAKLKKV